MKSLFKLILFLGICLGVGNATIVGGTVTNNNVALANGSVTFSLLGCANPLVNSSSGNPAIINYSFTLDANGNFPAASVTGNDIIYCSGTTGSTYYEIKAYNSAGGLIWDRYYRIIGAYWNIGTANVITNFAVSSYVQTNPAGDQVVNVPTNNKLTIAGGETLIANLSLGKDPILASDAATKNYVDGTIASVSGAAASVVGKINRAGDSMTGPFILAADPILPLQASTKQYVDNSIAGATTGVTNKLDKTGGTMSGPLILAADPTTSLGAATKQYVDNSEAGLQPILSGTPLHILGYNSSGAATQFNVTTDSAGNNLGIPGSLTGKQTNAHNMASQYTNIAAACGYISTVCNIDPNTNILDWSGGVFSTNNRFFPVNPFSRVVDERWGAVSESSEGPGVKHQINGGQTYSIYKPIAVTLSRTSNITTLTLTGVTDNRWCYPFLNRIIYGASNSSFNSPVNGSAFTSQINPNTCTNSSITYNDTGSNMSGVTAYMTAYPVSSSNLVYNQIQAGRGWGGIGSEAGGSQISTNCLVQQKGINSCGPLAGTYEFDGTGDFQAWGYGYLGYHHQELGNGDDEKGYGYSSQSNESAFASQFTINAIGSQPNYLYLNYSDGHPYPGGGHLLLETKNAAGASAAFDPGNITNANATAAAGMGALRFLTVDVSVPVSTAWGTATSIVVPPNAEMGVSISTTLSTVGGTSSPVTGWMCFADPQRFERLYVTVVGSMATGNFREPFVSSPIYWFQGGMCNAPTGGAVAAKVSGMIYGKKYKNWSSTTTYAQNDIVAFQISGEYLYFQSLANSNTNHTPSLSSTWWKTSPITNQVLKIVGSTGAHTIAYAASSSNSFRPIGNDESNITPETATGVTLTRNTSGLVTMTGVPTQTTNYEPLNWCERQGVVITATDTSFNGTVTTSCLFSPNGTYSWQTGNTTAATTTGTAYSDIDLGHIAFYSANEILNTTDDNKICQGYGCYVEVDPNDFTYAVGMTVEDDIGPAAEFINSMAFLTCYSAGCEGQHYNFYGDGIRGRTDFNELGFTAFNISNNNPCTLYQSCGGPYVGPTAFNIGGPWSTIFDFNNFNSAGQGILQGGTIFNLPCPIHPDYTVSDQCQGAGDAYNIFHIPSKHTNSGTLINNVPNDSLDVSWNPLGGESWYTFGVNSWKLGLANQAQSGTINGVTTFGSTPQFLNGITFSLSGDTEHLYTNGSFWFFPKQVQMPNALVVYDSGSGNNFTIGVSAGSIGFNSNANLPVYTNIPWNFSTSSVTFNGPTYATTRACSDNSGYLATTAFVQSCSITSLTGYATLASPSFTGTPTAPTATSGTNTTQLATTAFVQSAVASGLSPAAKMTVNIAAQTVTAGACSTLGPFNFTSGSMTAVSTSSIIMTPQQSVHSTTGYGPGQIYIDRPYYSTLGASPQITLAICNPSGGSITTGSMNLEIVGIP